MSRPTVSKAKTSYPIFSACFANSKPWYLVVGGGGGVGRHGVKNKISMFDFSTRAPTVESCAEIEASEDDSVTCLANLATKDGLILYAGINSSEQERLKDKNEHFRSFEVKFPKANRRTSNAQQDRIPQGNISFLSRTALFTPPASDSGKKEGYQRLVRLSPPQRIAQSTPNRRIGAIASSLAGDENEIVVFAATSNRPDNTKDVIQRIALHKGQEANDLDILDQGEGRFKVAYCLDYDIFVQDIHYDFGKKKRLGKGDLRRKLYSVPFPDVFEKKGRPRIRCLRWLSPSHILLAANKPNKSGVELLILRLYEEGPGSIILRKTLSRHAKASVDMDVALLDPDSDGAYQIVVAVGTVGDDDNALVVMTIDYHGQSRASLSSFRSFATYHGVHDLSITKVVFSPFFKPEASPGKKPGPQYLRLASTSLGNTVDVETFELHPISNKPKSRYILQSARSRTLTDTAKYVVIAMIVAAIALMLQSFIDPEGSLTRGLLPESLQNAASYIKTPGEVFNEARNAAHLQGSNSPIAKTTQRLRDILHLHSATPDSSTDAQQKAIIVHHDPDSGDSSLSTEVHADAEDVVRKHTEAKRWEELSSKEQKRWKEKLVNAGMWAVEEGETVLKGIFFSEAAGFVGRMAQGVIA